MPQASRESSTELPIPDRVELADGHLFADATAPHWRTARPAAFDQFTELDPRDDDSICRFAQKWGTMGICVEHGLPVSHSLVVGRELLGVRECFPRRISRPDGEFFAEPLWFWKRAIEKAGALRRIGADISSNGKGKQEDWLLLSDGIEFNDGMGKTKGRRRWESLPMARMILAGNVEQWLDVGGVRPSFSWDTGHQRWAMRQSTPRGGLWPLFGYLGIRLMTEIAGGRVAICPYCHLEYFPLRLPGRNQDHCCGKKECKRAYFTNYKREQKRRSESE